MALALPPDMPECRDAVPLVVTVHPSPTGPGQANYTFSGSAPDVIVDPDGRLRFGAVNRRILVTMQFDVDGWTWRRSGQIRAMSYALRQGGALELVGENGDPQPDRHRQVRWLRMSDDRTSFTFCYRNRNRDGDGASVPRSEYGLFMRYQSTDYTLDPIISNGGQPTL